MTKRLGETSYRETSFGIIPRSKLIPLEIEGIKKAWDSVVRERKKGEIAITSNFIKKLHEIGFAWIFSKTGGKFRKIEVTISDHEPPKFYLLPQLMIDYCENIKERLKHLPANVYSPDFIDKLIELLTWTHHRFLWIHPFEDYNGRIARLLINVILLNLDLPPLEMKVETKEGRKKYIKALQRADEGNYSDLEKIIKTAINESLKDIERT